MMSNISRMSPALLVVTLQRVQTSITYFKNYPKTKWSYVHLNVPGAGYLLYVYTYLLCIYWTRGVALGFFFLKKWSSLYSTLYHRGAVKVATFV